MEDLVVQYQQYNLTCMEEAYIRTALDAMIANYSIALLAAGIHPSAVQYCDYSITEMSKEFGSGCIVTLEVRYFK